MTDATVPGLKGLPSARGKNASDPFRVKLTPEAEQEFTQWLVNEITAAENARTSIIQEHGQIDYWHELYEQTPQSLSLAWPDAANLSSWIPVEKVDALRARLTQVVFGPSPICAVEGYGESQERCGKVEAFHEWKAKDEKLRTWFSRAIHNGLIEGNGILEVSERPLIRKFNAKARVNAMTDEQGVLVIDAKGNPSPKLKDSGDLDMWEGDETIPSMTVHYEDRVAVCDGPQYRLLSMKDFLFLPGHARDGSEVWGFAKRVYLRIPELEQRQAAGYYRNVERIGTDGDRQQRQEQTRQGLTIAPQEGVTAEKEIWEVHLFYDIDNDGIEEWLVATVSVKFQVCLRLEHDSLRQVRYVSVTPYPRADSVYAYSFVGHKIASVAEEHAGLRNQIADRGALAVNAPIKRITGGHWDPDDQPWGPNAVIEVARMDEIEQQTVTDVPQSAVFQKRDCEEAAERITGLNDQSAVGVRPSGHVTATEVQTEAHASFVRIDEPVHHLQEAMAELYQLRNEIWLRSLMAQEGGVAPRTSVLRGLQTMGLTLPTDGPFKFTAADLRGHFSFIPKGSVETADIYRQREDFNQFVAVALPALLKLSPALAAQFQQNPKFAEAMLQKAFHLYRMPELQNALTTAGPPQLPTATGEPLPPAGVPGAIPGASAGAGLPPALQQMIEAAMAHGAPVAGPSEPQ